MEEIKTCKSEVYCFETPANETSLNIIVLQIIFQYSFLFLGWQKGSTHLNTFAQGLKNQKLLFLFFLIVLGEFNLTFLIYCMFVLFGMRQFEVKLYQDI